jgi:hypothetical protein
MASATPADPHGIDVAISRIMGGSRRTAKAAALVLAGALAEGEMVEHILAGRFRAHDAVVALTDRRLLLVNARPWEPEVVSIDNVSGIGLEGWVERRAATFRITDGADLHVIDQINDTEIAEGFAATARVREAGWRAGSHRRCCEVVLLHSATLRT